MSKRKKIETETRHTGYFLMDSGLKVPFDISEEDGDENFKSLYGDMEFLWERGDVIWLGEENDTKILVDRIIGWDITSYVAEL